MMPSGAVDHKTREEWRELGFFYIRDDLARVWKLIGSRSGLLGFRDALLAYAEDPRRAEKSEHQHYGPYMYLEIMTWPEAGFDGHAIRGPLQDLKRLGAIVEAKLAAAKPGDTVCIQGEFSSNSPYALILEVREDGFDAAQADPMLPSQPG
jgi:hypothetical protein